MAHPTENKLMETLTSNSTLDAAYEWLEAQNAGVPAITGHQWAILKPQLQEQMGSGEYSFTAQTRVQRDDTTYDLWTDQDRIVLKALTITLTPMFKEHVSQRCFHLGVQGGAKAAVRETREYLEGNPDSRVMQSDVAGYYGHIDHQILYGRLEELIPREKFILRLLWQYMNRVVYGSGNYLDIDKGISLGCSLSPLMAALYLKPLDTVLEETNGFYARFMDDWVLVAATRWQLRKAVKQANTCLAGLGLEVEKNPAKTFIGRSEKGFDFLGYHLTPQQLTVSEHAIMRRDEKIARLYEQGAEKNRALQYVSRWQKWARAGVGVLAGGAVVLPSLAFGASISLPSLSGAGAIDVDGDGYIEFILGVTGGGDCRLQGSISNTAGVQNSYFTYSVPFGAIFPSSSEVLLPAVGTFFIRALTSGDEYSGWLTVTDCTYSSFYGASTRGQEALLLLPDGSTYDAPYVTGVPSDVTVLEDSESNIDFSTVIFADAADDSLTVTIAASAGAFSSPADGVGVAVTATLVNSATITLAGTAANINTYLDTAANINYTGASNVSGDNVATITLSATDGTDSLVSDPVVNIDITPVNDAPEFTGTPAITGTVKVGQTLILTDTGTTDAEEDIVTLSYQWQADGVDISDMISATYTVTSAIVDKTITCTITADDGNGGATSYTTTGVLATSFPWSMFLPAITNNAKL